MVMFLLGLALAQDVPTSSELQVAVSTQGVFAANKAGLSAEGHQQVGEWVSVVLNNPGWRFEVSVHTDSMGSGSYNQSLSQRRAQAVVDAMVQAGVPSERLVARGYGEERPRAPNATAEGRDQNRRLELRRLTASEGALPVASTPPVRQGSSRPTAPRSWRGMSVEIKGELRSGDEVREGKLQVDRSRVEVPFDAAFDVYAYHARGNDPELRLVGPGGRSLGLQTGRSQVELTAGTWTVEVRDARKAEGTWGMRIQGVSTPLPPAPDADACTVLDYLVAQSHVGMRDARGAAIDDNFVVAPRIPGLSGRAMIHRSDEYWIELYDGPSTATATEAWRSARSVLTRCLGSGWASDDSDWVTKSLKIRPDIAWRERSIRLTRPNGPKTILVKVVEEHRESGARARLYLYQTEAEQ